MFLYRNFIFVKWACEISQKFYEISVPLQSPDLTSNFNCNTDFWLFEAVSGTSGGLCPFVIEVYNSTDPGAELTRGLGRYERLYSQWSDGNNQDSVLLLPISWFNHVFLKIFFGNSLTAAKIVWSSETFSLQYLTIIKI